MIEPCKVADLPLQQSGPNRACGLLLLKVAAKSPPAPYVNETGKYRDLFACQSTLKFQVKRRASLRALLGQKSYKEHQTKGFTGSNFRGL